MKNTKTYYVIINLVKALLWLAAFVFIYLLFKKYINVDFLTWLEPLFDNEAIIVLIFLISEIAVGIIPPEVFIIWALRNDRMAEFISWVIVMSLLSYFAGVIGYYIGHNLNKSFFFRWTKKRFLSKLDERLQVFGGYLIIIAALTPVPFSGTCMLVGSADYPFKKFLLFTLTRFLKFGLSAIIFFEVDPNI